VSGVEWSRGQEWSCCRFFLHFASLVFKILSFVSADLLNQEKLVLGERWATKRPEELSPTDFIALTADLFGEEMQPIRGSSPAPFQGEGEVTAAVAERSAFVSRPVWRKALFGASGSPTFGNAPAAEK
jgi:hypothetical protein